VPGPKSRTIARWLAREEDRSLALVLGFGVVYAVLSTVVLRGFPFSGDEYSSLLQAEIFARGHLRIPAPAHADLFQVDHVVVDAWVRSKYPPGAAALLALGVLAHAAPLVNPLEGASALFFLRHAARRLFGERAATVTVVVCGVSPTFVYHAASFYSHMPAMMAVAAGLAAVTQWAFDSRRVWLVAAGVAAGFAFLTRPLDGVAFGAALLVLRKPRALAWIALGAAPIAGLLFVYDALQFGGPLTDGYAAYEPAFRATYGAEAARSAFDPAYLVDPDELVHHALTFAGALVEWSVPGAALAALVGASVAWRRPADPGRAVIAVATAAAVTSIGAMMLTITGADDGLPSRYLSVLTLPIALFAGPGWIFVADAWRAAAGRVWPAAASLLVVVLAGLELAAFLEGHLPQVWEREGLFRAVADQRLENAVVVVKARFPTRYLRNGPSFDGPVLYVRGDREVEDLGASFPGRSVYEAVEGRPWILRRVSPAAR